MYTRLELLNSPWSPFSESSSWCAIQFLTADRSGLQAGPSSTHQAHYGHGVPGKSHHHHSSHLAHHWPWGATVGKNLCSNSCKIPVLDIISLFAWKLSTPRIVSILLQTLWGVRLSNSTCFCNAEFSGRHTCPIYLACCRQQNARMDNARVISRRRSFFLAGARFTPRWCSWGCYSCISFPPNAVSRVDAK